MLVLTATMLKNKSIILKLKNCTLVPDLPSCCCLYKHVCFTFQSTLVSKTSSTTTKSSSRSQLPAKFNYMKKKSEFMCVLFYDIILKGDTHPVVYAWLFPAASLRSCGNYGQRWI